MVNPLDTDAGSELFSNYEAELKLVEADLTQKLDQIPELSGEERKQAVRGAERAVDEAKELVCPHAFHSLPRPLHCNIPPPVPANTLSSNK